MTSNEKIDFMIGYKRQLNNKFQLYNSGLVEHIKTNKPSIENLGFVSVIVENNGLSLNRDSLEELRSRFINKNTVQTDKNLFYGLTDEARKITKEFIDEFNDFSERFNEFLIEFKKMEYENFEVYEKRVQEMLEYVDAKREYLVKFMNDVIEEHKNNFEDFKKYKKLFDEIVSHYDISSRKLASVSTELGIDFKNSYTRI